MKRYTTIISFLFLSFILGAQVKYDAKVFSDENLLNKKYVDYYSGKTSVKGSTVTFVVDDKQESLMHDVELYNKNNKLGLNSNPTNKVTNESVPRRFLPHLPVDGKIANEIIHSSIAKDKLEMLSHTKNGYLRILMFVNPANGRVQEVYYTFMHLDRCHEMLFISPEELESIERLAKEKIVLKVPGKYEYSGLDCQSLNFVLASFLVITDNSILIE